MEVTIRPARDEDAGPLIALVRTCYHEYPGCILDVDLEAPELRAIDTHHRERDGAFWIAEREGRVVGSVGFVRSSDGEGVQMLKLYVAARERRRGLGSRLCSHVEREACSLGAKFVELWSDARFIESHRLYEKLGYIRGPKARELHDLSQSTEYYYRKELRD